MLTPPASPLNGSTQIKMHHATFAFTPVQLPACGYRALWRGTVMATLVLWLSACSTTRVNGPAPVEDRGTAPRPVVVVPGSMPAAAPVVVMPAPTVDYAGKTGYYTVKPGDSLIRIGLEVGQPWRDLARWNNLENPNKLEVGQVLRVLPNVPPVVVPGVVPAVVPGAAAVAGAVGTSPAAGSAAPVAPATAPVTSAAVTAQPLAPAAAPAAPAAAAPAPAAAPAAKAGEDDIAFIWPSAGSVTAGFDEQKNKGLGIAGKAGDPVIAAADGRVVYAGSGLRGYGNLIILKHNNTYLTAYAHNQALLVKEDQSVRQGQKIAEMGSSDADRVKLHFEIRKQGKPVDPAKLLPAR